MKKYSVYLFLAFILPVVFALMLAACSHTHSYGEWTLTRQETCTKFGLQIRVCECGQEETASIAPKGHSGGEWVTIVEPTCTTEGITQQICANCQLTLSVGRIEAAGHVEGQWCTDVEPTCSREGVKRLMCAVCAATLKTETIPAEPCHIVLDAGHGGSDGGAASGGVIEKDINLQVALKLKALLEEQGVVVFLTREGDETLKLSDRVEFANSLDAHLFLSVHCNYYEESPSVCGFEAYYYQNELAKYYADTILKDLTNGGQVKTRNVKSSELYVLKNTNIPAILLELGFLTNAEERDNLCDSEYQDILANTIASAVIKVMEKMHGKQ